MVAERDKQIELMRPKVKKTPKVTGKGQQYFVNKFLNNGIELKSS